ncbi:MAG: NADH-quinone oxidoreductase subunit M [Desulfobacteraceae bacterium]|nr:NADH-quinone oxidoreductase subunit M [Desulfobacteraceae bacterium]
MVSHILIQIVFVPIIAAILILFVRFPKGSKKGYHAGWITIGSLIYTSILLCKAGINIYKNGSVFEGYIIGPDVSLNLLADGLSLPIALIINIICLALAFYSLHYVDHRIELIYPDADEKTYGLYYKRFFFLYLFFPTGFMGVAFSTNLISMYVFLELLTIVPLYFIMAQFGYSDYITRYKVALMCLFWGVAGATLFFIGILLGFNEIGSFEIAQIPRLSGNPVTFWVILLILAGLCTKLAIVPFHVWMPWVHAEHPTCIAGLLAVYANIAVYIAVRVLIIPLPADMKIFSVPIMIMATITMIYGAFLTLAQTDAKRFCACSTISQISYSVFGIGAMSVMGIKGGLFYFLSHILGKAILFSTAGILVYTTGTRNMEKMGGLGKKMPLTAILWMVAALILSALPGTSGFVGKWLFFTGSFQVFEANLAGIMLVIVAIMSTLLTLVYTFLTGFKIFFGPLKMNSDYIKDPPLIMSMPILFLAILAITLGIFPDTVLQLFSIVIMDF